jgi:subtilisin family serine protease
MLLPHFVLQNTAESSRYKSSKVVIEKQFVVRDPQKHGEKLKSQFENAWTLAKTDQHAVSVQDINGVYIQFVSSNQFNLALKSLESMSRGIRLLNFTQSEDELKTQKATVFIPNNQRKYFLHKIDTYIASEDLDKIKNEALVSNIEAISQAVVESFWIGKPEDMPTNTPIWCEAWLRCNEEYADYEKVIQSFSEICGALQVVCSQHYLHFPERLIVAIHASYDNLSEFIRRFSNICEFRRGLESNQVILDSSFTDQKEWSDDLITRTTYQPDSNVSVCILDTGINSDNPLLKNIVQKCDLHTINPAWGVEDNKGHGTNMAGIVAYNDILSVLLSKEPYLIGHRIESVKIIPNHGDNPEELYGYYTDQAISLASITNPNTTRIVCLAVTAFPRLLDGRPSSWSGYVDALSYGDGDNQKLFLVSAGNVQCSELTQIGFPAANINHPIEDPAQSWNAVAVGAYTEKLSRSGLPSETRHCVDAGDISPYTSSSSLWNKNTWPSKPDIVCEGGNAIFCNDGMASEHPELSVLTASAKIRYEIFDFFCGTSPAVAQASWLAANIQKQYPDLWPETIRALLIHSANWTPAMIHRFIRTKAKSDYCSLMKFCGYGVPSLEKAVFSMENAVNIVLQDNLQPYEKLEGRNPRIKEMNFYDLPWPEEFLLSLHDIPVRVRITLSYFIEPGPGEIGWKDRYRYPSYALRFDLNNTDEDESSFRKRINVAAREEEHDQGDGSSGSDRWKIGKNNRQRGSIHSDFWEGTAAELSNCKWLAIYPVVGWWHKRDYLGKCNSTMRYAVVVSLETPDISVDLYNEIKNLIDIRTSITVTV